MDRDEILKRAQNENRHASDEMELQVTQKGSSIAIFCVFVIGLILMIVKIAAGQVWYDVYSLMFGGMAGMHLYKGIRLSQKHEVVLGGISAGAALLALGMAVFSYLG